MQIARYRAMTREQRVGIALRLDELACEMAPLDIRRWNRITPSERQLGDVAGAVQVQRQILHEQYLRHWGAQLGMLAALEAAHSGTLRPKIT
jgi:hypothetical protein